MTGEFVHNDVKDIKQELVENYKDIKPDKQMSTKELNDAVDNEFGMVAKDVSSQKLKDSSEKSELSIIDRIKIKLETGWSDKIIDCIKNMDQYEIYKKADLHEVIIDGRHCLIKNIDMDYVDPKTGKTNRELMEDGKSPIDAKTGEKIELHHMGQNYDSPFAELCENSEHGDGNHQVLHTKNGESWRNDPKLNNQYKNVDKPNHWKARVEG